jgi:toxin ParE1/3/4
VNSGALSAVRTGEVGHHVALARQRDDAWRRGYRALLTAALRRIAADPHGRSTTDRSELAEGVRSFHIRHSRAESLQARVGDPTHVIFYRAPEPGLIEIVRVLHERIEPSRYLGVEAEDEEKPKGP